MTKGPAPDPDKPHKHEMKCDCVDRLVSYMFRSLGWMVGKKPGYFIIVPFLISALLATGMQRINYVADPEYLFSPTDGPAKYERQVVETLFPMNLSRDFDVGRMTRISPFARIMIEAKDGKSIFDKDVYSDLKKIDKMVNNITIWNSHRLWKYKNMCAKKNRRCFENHILNFGDRIDDMASGKYSIDYPLMINEVTFNIFFSAAFLGGVKTDEFDKIESARAVNLLYFLEDAPGKIERANQWEGAFLQLMEEAEFEFINIAYYTSLTLSAELEKNTISVLPLFSVTVVIMLAFSVSTCMMLDWVKSKPWLGVIGCFSSAVAVAGAFGLTAYCGLEFIGLNLAAPFLMLGIGMDDTFVLLAAWRRTDDRLSVPERLSITFADAGVSITITSLTNFISFWIGVITPFPCVRIFCIYTAMAVLFTYLYHITFFGGVMALSGYAEQRNLHGFICVPTMPKSLSRAKILDRNADGMYRRIVQAYFRCLQEVEVNRELESWIRQLGKSNEFFIFILENRGKCYNLLCTGGRNPLDPDNPLDNEENMMMRFFRDKLGVWLSKKSVKFSVIFVFLIYISVGLYGCTKVKEGLERFKMARYDSYSLDYYDFEDKYFRKYPYRIQVVINKTLDYSDPKVQEEVEELLHRLENNRLMAGNRFTESWLRIYHRFMKDQRTQVFLQGYNMSSKEDFYKGIRQVFFRLSQNYFQQDIKFNEDFTEITASRFVLQTENIMDANDEKNMLIELRAIAANSTLPVVVFNQLFVLFDQFLLIKETSIQAVGVATAVMMVISFLFIPNPNCALWVAFSIFSIEIGVVGFMSLWNVNLDAISMINLILCIGFSVDYSAHITYAFISSTSKDPDQRMKSALHSLGLPIAQGSVSTILGIIVLNAAPSYIFSVFFKTVFLVILFAALHGLLLLPVLLSLTDGWCSGSRREKPEKEGTPPFYITSQQNDILANHDSKTPTYRTLADPHLSIITEEPKYKTTATWTDNGDLDQGIGTSGESSDGSWRGNDEIIDHAHQLHGSSSKLTPVGQPDDSPRTREREDHVNPGFVDDDDLRGSDRNRMGAYHCAHKDNKAGYNGRWESLQKQQESPKKNHRDLPSSNNDDQDSPLSRYMSRLNSGYVREFQMPL